MDRSGRDLGRCPKRTLAQRKHMRVQQRECGFFFYLGKARILDETGHLPDSSFPNTEDELSQKPASRARGSSWEKLVANHCLRIQKACNNSFYNNVSLLREAFGPRFKMPTRLACRLRAGLGGESLSLEEEAWQTAAPPGRGGGRRKSWLGPPLRAAREMEAEIPQKSAEHWPLDGEGAVSAGKVSRLGKAPVGGSNTGSAMLASETV